MFYLVSAYNTQALYAWASDESDVARYVDWLNRGRVIDCYRYECLGESPEVEEGQTPYEKRDDVLSMDEPYWDHFMEVQ
jgi:hypothetical protein